MLTRANLVVFALLIAHTVDHAVNQPTRELPATGSLVALIGFALVATSTVLAARRRREAPIAAMIAGFATALGIVAIHLAPSWYGDLSDPYWDFDANAISWALLIAPLLGGLWLALLGARELSLGAANGANVRHP